MDDAVNPFRSDPDPQGPPMAPTASDDAWRAPEAAPSAPPHGQEPSPQAEDADRGSMAGSSDSPSDGAPGEPISAGQPDRAAEESSPEVSAPAADGEPDEAALLDQLESDLAAVETAIASIEQIATDSVGGEQAAAEIRAAVSAERFGG